MCAGAFNRYRLLCRWSAFRSFIYSSSLSKCFNINKCFHHLLSPASIWQIFRIVIFSCIPLARLFISHFSKGIRVWNKDLVSRSIVIRIFLKILWSWVKASQRLSDHCTALLARKHLQMFHVESLRTLQLLGICFMWEIRVEISEDYFSLCH